MNIWISLATLGIIQVNLLCAGAGGFHRRRIGHFQDVHDAEVDGPSFNKRPEEIGRSDEGYANRAEENAIEEQIGEADFPYEARRLDGAKRVCKRVCKRSGGVRHCKREC